MTSDDQQLDEKPDFYRVDLSYMRIAELCNALAAWESKRPDGGLPVWGDLDFLDFEPQILPRMILLDVDHKPGFGTYRYWGTRVASFNATDMTGQRVNQLAPSRHANYSERQYQWIVTHREPSLFVACLGEKSWNKKYEAMLRMPCHSVVGTSAIDRILSVGFYDDVQQTIKNFVDVDIDLDNYFA